jgi:hypothetical protein
VVRDRRVLAILLISVGLLMLATWAVRAKLPSGYQHTRGLYIFFDDTTLTPSDVAVVGSFQRYNWRDLEPSNNSYNWAMIDDAIVRWQGQGKLAAVGFSFFNEHEGTGEDRGIQIPSWLPGIDGQVQWFNTRPNAGWYIPNYWNQSFRTYYRRFVREFARHIAEDTLSSGARVKDRMAWVSMGVGMSGETQPCKVWLDPYTRSEDYYYYNDVQGITSEQWLEYVNWCTDTYKQAFDDYGLSIPIFLDIGPTYKGERDQFSSYAVSRGVGLRNNGLKVDRPDARTIYSPMATYNDRVPIAWETYGTPNWLDSKSAVLWGLRCGLAKHPDNFTVDKTLVQTEEYRPLLAFAARYCGVTVSTTPGAWVALRQSEHHPGGGEDGNYNLWLRQVDDAPGGHAPAVWNVGQGRGYKFDLPNGSYDVELHFAEVYYNQAGVRVFDIKIEGQVVADNFDIWAAAGGKNRAVTRTFQVTVSDGRLDIDVVPETNDEPTVHAIKVSGPGYVARINCGGRSYTDQASNTWTADREYAGGSFGYWGGGIYFSGADMAGTDDDYLYQSMRLFGPGSLADGRYARRTEQGTSNTRMYFDIDNGYMYSGSFSQAVITVTYCTLGTDSWQLKYDAVGDADKVAVPYGGGGPSVVKDGSQLWRQAVFQLTDARFANGQPGGTDFSIDCLGDGDEYISFVEISKDVGVGPSTATIEGSLNLQRSGTPAPHPSWSVPLTVTVGGTPHGVTTDQSGAFTLAGLTPGTHDIQVKNAHTISNLKAGVVLNPGNNTVDLGELKEGDVNNDDTVNSSDFLLLRSSYFMSEGQPGFVDGADLNEDGIVNSSDFLLLRGNYFLSGPIVINGS